MPPHHSVAPCSTTIMTTPLQVILVLKRHWQGYGSGFLGPKWQRMSSGMSLLVQSVSSPSQAKGNQLVAWFLSCLRNPGSTQEWISLGHCSALNLEMPTCWSLLTISSSGLRCVLSGKRLFKWQTGSLSVKYLPDMVRRPSSSQTEVRSWICTQAHHCISPTNQRDGAGEPDPQNGHTCLCWRQTHIMG